MMAESKEIYYLYIQLIWIVWIGVWLRCQIKIYSTMYSKVTGAWTDGAPPAGRGGAVLHPSSSRMVSNSLSSHSCWMRIGFWHCSDLSKRYTLVTRQIVHFFNEKWKKYTWINLEIKGQCLYKSWRKKKSVSFSIFESVKHWIVILSENCGSEKKRDTERETRQSAKETWEHGPYLSTERPETARQTGRWRERLEMLEWRGS